MSTITKSQTLILTGGFAIHLVSYAIANLLSSPLLVQRLYVPLGQYCAIRNQLLLLLWRLRWPGRERVHVRYRHSTSYDPGSACSCEPNRRISHHQIQSKTAYKYWGVIRLSGNGACSLKQHICLVRYFLRHYICYRNRPMLLPATSMWLAVAAWEKGPRDRSHFGGFWLWSVFFFFRRIGSHKSWQRKAWEAARWKFDICSWDRKTSKFSNDSLSVFAFLQIHKLLYILAVCFSILGLIGILLVKRNPTFV